MLNLFTFKKKDGTEVSFGIPAAVLLIVIVIAWIGRPDLLAAILQALHFH